MKFYMVLALTLMGLGSLAERTKGRKALILPSNSILRQMDIEQLLQMQNDYEDDEDDDQIIESLPSVVAPKADSSRGRLFFNKFFQFGKQSSSRPQIIIIAQPASTAASATTDGNSFTYTVTGNSTTSPAAGRVGDASGDYANDDGDDDNDEDEYDDDEIPNERKQQPTIYKLVKGKANHQQQGLGFVVPSKYMRNFQNNNRNTLVVNPSGTYNSGSSKMKKFRLSNAAAASAASAASIANGKRKRSRSPVPVRRFVSQN